MKELITESVLDVVALICAALGSLCFMLKERLAGGRRGTAERPDKRSAGDAL